MRVEIDDWIGNRHTISTADPELAGRWFAEHAIMLMSANAALGDCWLRIWPSTREEHQAFGPAQDIRLTQDGLLSLAQRILDASAAIGEREQAP